MISCDLGSNTIRFVEIDCKTKKRVKEFERIVRTADGLSSSGVVSNEAVDRVVSAIDDAKEIFDFSKGIVAVTTEAIRVAKNQSEVLEKIYQKSGLKFRVLSGNEEAFLTNYAVSQQIDTKSYTLLDIGGGSTEITFVEKDEIISKSFPLGIVTLTQEVEEKGQDSLSQVLSKKIEKIEEFFKDKKFPKKCVATAGTPTTIVAFLKGIDYDSYDYEKINKTILSLEDIFKVKKELLQMPYHDRKKWVGVGREDLIISGIDILVEFLRLFDFDSCEVVDDGLREGVALYECNKNIKC